MLVSAVSEITLSFSQKINILKSKAYSEGKSVPWGALLLLQKGGKL